MSRNLPPSEGSSQGSKDIPENLAQQDRASFPDFTRTVADQPGGGAQPHMRGIPLADRVRGTVLEQDQRVRNCLGRLDRVDASSFSLPLLQQATRYIRTELAKMIDCCREGRVDWVGMGEMVKKIDRLYRMHDEHPSEKALLEHVSKEAAVLRHINELDSAQAASVIIPCATSDRSYTLTPLIKTRAAMEKAQEGVEITPIRQADALYRVPGSMEWYINGKVRVDQVQPDMQALLKALRKNPGQLSELAEWRRPNFRGREACIVLVHPPGSWLHIFRKIDSDQPTSSSLCRLLVKYGVSLHMGGNDGVTLMSYELGRLQANVGQIMEGKSGAQRAPYLARLSETSPKDVASDKFRPEDFCL